MNNKDHQQSSGVFQCREPFIIPRRPDSDVHESDLRYESQMQVIFSNTGKEKTEIKARKPVVTNNQFVKVTEVHLKDRVLKLVDTFQAVPFAYPLNLNSLQQELKDSHKPKEKIDSGKILDRRPFLEDELVTSKVRTRGTRNTVKDITKLFKHWVKQKTPSHLRLEELLELFLSVSDKYNNNLIYQLSKNHKLRKAFMTFAKEQGEQRINKSKIKDKQANLKALNYYFRICQNEDVKDNGKTSAEAEGSPFPIHVETISRQGYDEIII